MSDLKITLVLQPAFQLTVTREIVEALRFVARHHYDHRCRAAAEPGGFLWGWSNAFFSAVAEERPQTAEVTASWGDLDTTLKICEMATYSLPEYRLLETYPHVVHFAMRHARGALSNLRYPSFSEEDLPKLAFNPTARPERAT